MEIQEVNSNLDSEAESSADADVVREDFLDKLNEAGNPSLWWILLMFVASIPGLCYTLSTMVFMKPDPAHFQARCYIPSLENESWTFDQIREISMPINSSCFVYLYDYSSLKLNGYQRAVEFVNSRPRPSFARCKSFVYKSDHQYHVHQEYGLLCEGLYKQHILDIAPAYGKMIAGLLITPFADILGRKKVMDWGFRIFLAAGILTPLGSTYELVVLGRIMMGTAYSVMKTTVEVVVVEISNAQTRKLVFIAMNASIGISFCVMPLIANSISYWRTLHWAVSGTFLLLPLTIWYVPDSPRWFLTKGKKKHALTMLRILKQPVVQAEWLLYTYRNEKLNCVEEVHKHAHGIRPFLTKKLWFFTVLYLFSSVVYFKNYIGHLPLNVKVGRDVYFILSGAIEVVGLGVCFLLLQLTTRRSTIGIAFLLTNITYAISSQLRSDSIEILILTLMVEIATSVGIVATRLYITESVPTTHRCTIAGFAEAFGSSISTVLLFIIFTEMMQINILYVVLASLSLCGLVIIFYADEHKNNAIFDSVTEMKY